MRTDLTLLDANGIARDVAVISPPGATWREVRPLLGGTQRWHSGGRALRDTDPLGGPLLRDGAVLTVAAAAGERTDEVPTGHRLDVVGGPDTGRGVPLGRAPVTVGRARDCTLVLRDPRVSRRHAQLALGVRGATVRDCGSAGGTYVEGVAAGDPPVAVPAAAYVRVGDTFLRVSGPEAVRPDHPPADAGEIEIELPLPPVSTAAARMQWAGAALPAALGGGLAVAMHSAQFLLFALLSPVALLGSAVSDRLHHRRERRRSRRHYRRRIAEVNESVQLRLAAEAAERRAADPDPAALLRAARKPHRAATAPTAQGPCARLGLADLPSSLFVREGAERRPAGITTAVPYCVDLARGPLGIAAPAGVGRAVARWVVGQLVARAGPDGIELWALLDPAVETAWRWLRWLPQLNAPAALTTADQADLVADLTAVLDQRLSASRRGERWTGPWAVLLIDGASEVPGLADLLAGLPLHGEQVGITAVCVGADRAPLPAGCVTTAAAGGETGSTLQATGPDGDQQLIADQVDEWWCEELARVLAPGRPRRAGAGTLPASCSLLELLGLAEPSAQELAERWRAGGDTLSTLLGVARDGPVRLDLVRDGPHALVAGTTGSGKSELLRTLVAGLAANHAPDEVGFVLIDYKGGSAFAECAELAHTVGVVTDLDGHLAARALASLECELRRRERLFAAVGARDFSTYRGRTGGLSRLVIVVDEFAELAAELPEFVSGLVGVARRGRSLGVHLVLATQRPAGVVSAEIRANTAIRVALRMTDAGDSQDVIDTPAAAVLDRHHPGRAYLRLPGCAPVLLQSALVSGAAAADQDEQVQVIDLDGWRRPVGMPAQRPTDTGLRRLVDAVREAARLTGRDGAARPWLPPLPETVAVGSLAAQDASQVPLGLLDLPREQRQAAFAVDVAAGGTLLFAGGPGSGRTSALCTLAAGAAARFAPDRLHLHVLDHAGGGLAGLAALPHCGSVALDDPAVSARLLDRLSAEVSRRRAKGPPCVDPALLVLLDGWEQFLAAAEHQADARMVETLLGLLRAGPSVGLTLALTGDRGALASRLSSAVAQKLVLRLTDRGDYALLGLADQAVPARLPPGRAVRAEDGAELQLAHLGDGPARGAAWEAITGIAQRWADAAGPAAQSPSPHPAPIRVRALPASVRLHELPRPDPHGGSASAPVVLGVGGDAGEPLVVDLFAGRGRLLVAGPPGSGRSTLLVSLLDQLSARGSSLLVAAPETSPLAARARAVGATLCGPGADVTPAPGGRAALLLDDAEAFLDAPAGDTLTAWAQQHPQAALVVSGCSDDLALTFRGIAAHVRKARCAVLLTPGPGDGELVGVRLSRAHTGGPPGRGVVVGDRAWGWQFAAPVAIQVAQP
ncbi:MAG TPA: FtsK/SpoIIIE domain-containing protein [Jatrophihabitantaceae bacterium]|nr:FtsK/SpoIIIE domain-containing protein [Jatrophihabitantaceae bacterium]